MLIDTEKCTGCRACVVACKEWNGLAAERNRFKRTEQGQPHFSAIQWTDVVFSQQGPGRGSDGWLYTRLSCMHCTDAACVMVCPSGALSHNDFGAVEVDKAKCIGCSWCVANCTFHTVGFDQARNVAQKCDFCSGRIRKGMAPACADACPSGALVFGRRDELIPLAAARVQQLRDSGLHEADTYGLTELGGLRMIYILGQGKAGSESVYSLPESPQVPPAANAWGQLFRPLRSVLSGALIFALWASYTESSRRGG